MPTYTYQCEQCKYQFEEFQKMSDAPLTTCPTCNGKVHRLITGGSGLIFKGSGFYITDYKGNHAGNSSRNGNGTASEKADNQQKSGSAEKGASVESVKSKNDGDDSRK